MSSSKALTSQLTDPFLTPATLAMYLWPHGPDQWIPQKHLTYAAARITNAIIKGNGRLIISMPPRHGKQCADSTLVPTLHGWVTHGELSVGDYVFGVDGQPKRVLAVSEPSQATLIVAFMDGSFVQCHPNHEWTVFDRSSATWCTLETKQIAARKLVTNAIKPRCTLQVAVPEALAYQTRDLPVPPYILGAWLGDGSVGKGCLTGSSKRGKHAVLEAVGAHYPFSSKWVHKDTGVDTWSYQDLKEDLRSCGVLDQKHIPISYKESSIEQRLQLIAGLIDTDGSVDKGTGRVRYVGANERLVRDVAEVARGLGWNVYVTSQEPSVSSSGIVGRQTIWTAAFNPTLEIPTKVTQKVGGRVLETRRMLGIKAVYAAETPEPGRCIQVDSADGLYLVGKNLIPTHNSRLVSESTIPWFLQKFPGKNMMFVAYNGEFAEEWGGKAKDIINARQDLFKYKLRDDRSRVDRFETTTGSTCWFAGINGGQTGKGAHLVVIDDYIKDIEQAMSPTEREKIWKKFVANIFTRLEPGASIIIVATRWWSDDLIGRVLKHLKGWEYICFPAIAKPIQNEKGIIIPGARDILGRKSGDVLFPERFPIARLEEMRAASDVSGVIFDAMYQQEPVDDQSDFTDGSWLMIANGVNPNDYTCCRAWDMAATQGGGDYTTGTKMGRKGLFRQAFIFNVIRKQLSPKNVEQQIRETAVADGVECVVLLEQEPGSQGQALVDHYKRNVLPEFKVIGVPAGNKSKLLKAQPFIAAAESGNVFLVDNRPPQDLATGEEVKWIKSFRTEFHDFPPSSGGNDDQIDTASICYNHLYQHEIKSPTWGRSSLVGDMSQVSFGIGSYASTIDPSLDATYAQGGGSGKLVKGFVW